MEQLTDQELEELILGIEISPSKREEPSPSPGPIASPPPVHEKTSARSYRIRVWIAAALGIALVLGFAFGVASSGFAARENLEKVSSQLDLLLDKLDQYEGAGKTLSSQIIESLDSPAPFDHAA